MSEFKEIKVSEINESAFKLIGDDWMLVTAKKDGVCNTMTASWGGLGVLWYKNVCYVVIRPQRYTKEFVDSADTFSLTFFDKDYKKALGYLGTVSGRDEDKINKANLTIVEDNDTPYFEEARLVFLCKKLFAQPLEESSFIDKELIKKCYPENDLHILYIAEITKVLKK